MRRLVLVLLGIALATPAWASSDAGGGSFLGLSTLTWQVLNFLLLVTVLFVAGRGPVLSYLASRRAEIQGDLSASKELLAQAEAKLSEWQERTGRLESELAQIRDTSRRLAEQERNEILAQAHASAERIRSDATAAVEQELRRARAELSAEASELAVELAGTILREQVGSDDQQRLFDEFLQRIGDAPRPGNGS
jgi:F-type H+-transporting ATPase subunit b